MSADAHTFLIEARGRIASSWTQHADARSSDGSPVDPWSGGAVSWSLLGALVAVYAELQRSDGEDDALSSLARACMKLADTVDSDSLADWNDAAGRTEADVLRALDEAASALGA